MQSVYLRITNHNMVGIFANEEPFKEGLQASLAWQDIVTWNVWSLVKIWADSQTVILYF